MDPYYEIINFLALKIYRGYSNIFVHHFSVVGN